MEIYRKKKTQKKNFVRFDDSSSKKFSLEPTQILSKRPQLRPRRTKERAYVNFDTQGQVLIQVLQIMLLQVSCTFFPQTCRLYAPQCSEKYIFLSQTGLAYLSLVEQPLCLPNTILSIFLMVMEFEIVSIMAKPCILQKTIYVKNSLHCNMVVLFLTFEIMEAVRGPKTCLRRPKIMKQ